MSFRFSTVPYSGFPLPNDFRLFISRSTAFAPVNMSVEKQLGQTWHGNIVLAKYGRGAKDGLVQIQIPELAILQDIVGL